MGTHRRGPGEGSIYPRWRRDPQTGEREPAGWVGMLSAGRDPDGRRRRLAVYGRSRAEVVCSLNELRRRRERGALPRDRGRTTVEQWLNTWLEASRPRLRPRTVATYRASAALVARQLGQLRLAKLTPTDIEQALGAMVARGLSPRTARHALVVLRSALAQAVRDGLLEHNPAQLAVGPRLPRTEQRCLDSAQVAALLAAVREDAVLHPAVALSVACGLRQGELLGLRWQDLDLERGELRVVRTLQRLSGRGMVPAEPKSSAARRLLLLHPELVELLRQHRQRQLERRLELGPRWQGDDWVITDHLGAPVPPESLRRRFRQALATAGLPEVRWHDLRHTAASLLLLDGVPPKAVQEVLGHSSVSLTLGTYAHVLAGLRDLAREAQGRILGCVT